MPETHGEPVAPPKLPKPAPARSGARTRWLKRILVLLIALWVAGEGISVVLQHTRLRRLLTAQIEAAMGRSVEVGSYAFSFWGGPVVEARSVTVSEDPRFGAEYFLRADSMSVRLLWRSLLRGRLEFGMLSLNRPSLNLVRNSDGDWNLAQWLPRPAASPASRLDPGPVLPSKAMRFRRIEVERGRINFKFAEEKIPFAFVDVSGVVETNAPGRWLLNLQAIPWRSAVVLQHAGTIRVSGDVGGTSSRLRPASLKISWTDASLSDVLRLARRDDFGVRGAMSLSIDARTDASGDMWIAQGRGELREIHRWDLASRPDNPSVNLAALLSWRPAAHDLDLTRAVLETPRSSAEASGRLSWGREALPAKGVASPAPVLMASAEIDASDLLASARAFHPGIADALSARGVAHARARFAGWPPHLTSATLLSDGADLSGAPIRKALHLARLQLRYEKGVFSFLPISVSWGPVAGAPDGSFRLDEASARRAKAGTSWRISGATRQLRDLVAGASALGWNISLGWDVAGPFSCDLRWPGGAQNVEAWLRPLGWMEFGTPSTASDGAAVRTAFLNFPIERIAARVELTPGARKVQLSSALAFGARWSGWLERRDSAASWQFALSADRFAAADLDRWLNPRWRQSFLDRMLPFLNSHSSAAAAPEGLRARGLLSVERFALARLIVSRLQGNLEINGRHITLTNAAGQFFGGQIAGSVDAVLRATPSYRADFDVSRVGVASVLAATPATVGISADSGSAHFTLAAQGATRADLADSLTCRGAAHVTGLELQNVQVLSPAGDSSAGGAAMRFSNGSADFSCAQRSIEFQHLSLQGSDAVYEGFGAVDFSRNVDLRLHLVDAAQEARNPEGETMRLTGTLPALQLAPVTPAPSRRSR